VLEVGCGEGTLTRALRERGHRVTGIDPAAPREVEIERIDLAAFGAPARSFDAVIASLCLHHIADLETSLNKIALLLNSSGVVIVQEYGWERMDERTAVWYQRAWTRLGEGARKGPAPPTAERTMRNWRSELSELHPAKDMLAALAARFDEREFSWQPHLARELGAPELEPEERQAIARGEITAVGFFYCGALEDV
jgi:SAM-dependent methyltransferase